MLSRILISASILVFISCNSSSDKKSDKDSTANIVSMDTTSKKTGPPRLYCLSMPEDSMGNPHHDIMLSLDGSEKKLASINACNEISKENYKTYEIPENAVSAVGGFWAGLGSYFYLVEKDGRFVVYEGFTDEGQKEKGYHWKEMSGQ